MQCKPTVIQESSLGLDRVVFDLIELISEVSSSAQSMTMVQCSVNLGVVLVWNDIWVKLTYIPWCLRVCWVLFWPPWSWYQIWKVSSCCWMMPICLFDYTFCTKLKKHVQWQRLKLGISPWLWVPLEEVLLESRCSCDSWKISNQSVQCHNCIPTTKSRGCLTLLCTRA